eukprot:RCo020115
MGRAGRVTDRLQPRAGTGKNGDDHNAKKLQSRHFQKRQQHGGCLGKPPPHSKFRNRMLKLPLCLSNHKRNSARRPGQLEMRGKQFLQSVQSSHRYPITVHIASKPALFRGVLLEPCVGVGDNQQPSHVNALVNHFQERLGIIQPIDQVDRRHEVIIVVLRIKVAGIRLKELRICFQTPEIHLVQCHGKVLGEIPFLCDGKLDVPFLYQLQGHADEPGREVKSNDVLKAARQFEHCSPNSTAQVQGTTHWMTLTSFDGNLSYSPGEIRDTVVLRAIVEVTVEGHRGVTLINVVPNMNLLLRSDVADPCVLKEVPAKGVAREAVGLVAGGDP